MDNYVLLAIISLFLWTRWLVNERGAPRALFAVAPLTGVASLAGPLYVAQRAVDAVNAHSVFGSASSAAASAPIPSMTVVVVTTAASLLSGCVVLFAYTIYSNDPTAKHGPHRA